MKILRCVLLISAFSTAMWAQGTWTLTPLLNYEYLSFQGQRIHAPGEGVLFTSGNMNPAASEERDSLLIAGVCKQYFVQEEQDGYPDTYHAINILVDRRIKRHCILGLAVAESDKPFYGGWRSFIAGLGYGYECIRSKNVSLTLGIGVGIGDFGIELPGGGRVLVMPMPIIRFTMDTSILDASFEFLKKPVLTLTLFPEYTIRLINTFTINQIQFRDSRDFLFDTRLMYRLFSKESRFGDFAGLGIGIKNGAFGFPLADESKSYELVYHSVYGMIDLSFLQIQAGYSFNGMEIYDLERQKNIGDGLYLNVVLAWQF